MVLLFLLQHGPPIAGLLLALLFWWIRRDSHWALTSGARRATAVGLIIGLGGMIASTAGILPSWIAPNSDDRSLIFQLVRFLAPLVLCAIALLCVGVPQHGNRSQDSADLVPRTLVSFAPRGWLISAAALVALTVVVSVCAGLASIPDEAGRHVLYSVNPTSTNSASTTMYGWWFSVPSLAVIALLIVLALGGLFLVSRPPIAIDREADSAQRTARVRSILIVMCGGLLLHLGSVFHSLSGTSSMRLGFQGGESGWVALGTSFAALGPALRGAAFVAVILGFTLWWGVLLSTVSTRERQPSVAARR